MKNFDRFMVFPAPKGAYRWASCRAAFAGCLLPEARAHLRDLGFDQCAGAHPLQSVDHDAVAGLQARCDDAQAIDRAAERDRAIRCAIVVADHHHELLVLVGADRALVDHHERLLLRLAHAHARELARDEMAVVVGEYRADPDGAALAIDLVVDQLDVALRGESRRTSSSRPESGRDCRACRRHRRPSSKRAAARPLRRRRSSHRSD